MTDELAMESPKHRRKTNFWRSRYGILIIILILMIILAGIFSWWLSQGKISSVAARLDTEVYTVEIPFSTQMTNVYVKPGDIVSGGQVLGNFDPAPLRAQYQHESNEIINLRNRGMQAIADRLSNAQQTEKDMVSRVNQARSDEENARIAMEEQVTTHVRAQLRMRSISPNNRGGYAQAQQAEEAARNQMEAAKANFEQVSRMRAALDHELLKVRNDIMRARQIIGLPVQQEQASKQDVAINTDIISPIAGRVVKVNTFAGQMIQKDKPLFIILPISPNQTPNYWIQAWFPAADTDELRNGQKVSLKFENNSLHLNGTIVAIGSAAERALTGDGGSKDISSLVEENKYNSSQYLPVRIAIDDAADFKGLVPGSKVECQIQTRYLF